MCIGKIQTSEEENFSLAGYGIFLLMRDTRPFGDAKVKVLFCRIHVLGMMRRNTRLARVPAVSLV